LRFATAFSLLLSSSPSIADAAAARDFAMFSNATFAGIGAFQSVLPGVAFISLPSVRRFLSASTLACAVAPEIRALAHRGTLSFPTTMLRQLAPCFLLVERRRKR